MSDIIIFYVSFLIKVISICLVLSDLSATIHDTNLSFFFDTNLS